MQICKMKFCTTEEKVLLQGFKFRVQLWVSYIESLTKPTKLTNNLNDKRLAKLAKQNMKMIITIIVNNQPRPVVEILGFSSLLEQCTAYVQLYNSIMISHQMVWNTRRIHRNTTRQPMPILQKVHGLPSVRTSIDAPAAVATSSSKAVWSFDWFDSYKSDAWQHKTYGQQTALYGRVLGPMKKKMG